MSIDFKLTLGSLPSSQKIYVASNENNVSVPMRQINLSEKSSNKNFVVYDTSGIYTDNQKLDQINLNQGLPKIRQQWVLEREDVAYYQGRQIKPEDHRLPIERKAEA